ncbi:MAG: thermonuclease family protein [Boseongicola sp. SB0667_bin_21]|nr:thermonuclease family protein [Boseongicola sp. SB0667_bin_21]
MQFTGSPGAAATEALRARAEAMSCVGGETDRYGRTIGTCSAGGTDLNAWLVANGWALAYQQFSEDYAHEEAQARAARLRDPSGQVRRSLGLAKRRKAGGDGHVRRRHDIRRAGRRRLRGPASRRQRHDRPRPVAGIRDVRDDGRRRRPGRERGGVLRKLFNKLRC